MDAFFIELVAVFVVAVLWHCFSLFWFTIDHRPWLAVWFWDYPG